MWFVFALLSAVFAALTSILAKVGIDGVNSNLATAIRTVVVLAMAWGMVFLTNAQGGVASISRRSWIFLILSGLATGSIAVVADAFNNLSDAASSVITLVGFRLAGQDADQEHPFGHGRMEYLTGLVVALAILLMGVEIGKSSLEKIFSPEVTTFSWMAVVILFLSILVKLWMFFFNRTLGRRIGSAAMEATAADSLSDSVSTGVVLLSTLISHFLHVQVDGFAGLLVAVFILKTGWDSARETLDPLLGRPMDPSLAADIDRLVLSHPHILNIHDLVYHDYGPGPVSYTHPTLPTNSRV